MLLPYPDYVTIVSWLCYNRIVTMLLPYRNYVITVSLLILGSIWCSMMLTHSGYSQNDRKAAYGVLSHPCTRSYLPDDLASPWQDLQHLYSANLIRQRYRYSIHIKVIITNIPVIKYIHVGHITSSDTPSSPYSHNNMTCITIKPKLVWIQHRPLQIEPLSIHLNQYQYLPCYCYFLF